MNRTFERVRSIIVDLLGVDQSEVTRDARFREDLGADSLDLVELIMEFEDEFGKTISDEEAVNIVTVGEAVDHIHSRFPPEDEEGGKLDLDKEYLLGQ